MIRSNVVIVLCCGLPGTGKTSTIQSIINAKPQCANNNARFYHLCFDKIFEQWNQFKRRTNIGMADIDDESEIHNEEGSFAQRKEWKESRMLAHEITMRIITYHLLKSNKSNEQQHPNLQEHAHLDTQFVQDQVNEIVFQQSDSQPQSTTNDLLHVLLLDDNFYYRSMRLPYYQLARNYEIGFLQVFFRASLDECLRRNRARNEQAAASLQQQQQQPIYLVPDQVIIDMEHKMEYPESNNNSSSSSESGGGWEAKNSIEVYTTDENTHHQQGCGQLIAIITDRIARAAESPLMDTVRIAQEQRQKSIEQNLASIVHQVDMRTRKIIATLMKEQILEEHAPNNSNGICSSGNNKGQQKQQIGALLNQGRKEFLDQLRNKGGEIAHCFPELEHDRLTTASTNESILDQLEHMFLQRCRLLLAKR